MTNCLLQIQATCKSIEANSIFQKDTWEQQELSFKESHEK